MIKDITIDNYEVALSQLDEVDRLQLLQDMEDFEFSAADIYNPPKGQIAEVFDQGGGTQIQFGTSINWYEKLGFLEEIK